MISNKELRIKYLVMDVDGTLTDGRIYMGPEGEAFKAFNIKDGYGIHDIAMPNGIIPVIITGRYSRITENRCKELGIDELHQSVSDKNSKLMEVLERYKGELAQVAYIGDDLNDLEVMQIIKREGGLIGCPANAVIEIREISDFVAPKNGGDGAVREFVEWIIKNE